MQRLRLEVFLDTLDEDVQDGIHSLVADRSNSIFEEGVQGYVESLEFDDVARQYESFIVEMSAKSKTFAYWSMYIKMTGKALFPIFTKCVDGFLM